MEEEILWYFNLKLFFKNSFSTYNINLSSTYKAGRQHKMNSVG